MRLKLEFIRCDVRCKCCGGPIVSYFKASRNIQLPQDSAELVAAIQEVMTQHVLLETGFPELLKEIDELRVLAPTFLAEVARCIVDAVAIKHGDPKSIAIRTFCVRKTIHALEQVIAEDEAEFKEQDAKEDEYIEAFVETSILFRHQIYQTGLRSEVPTHFSIN